MTGRTNVLRGGVITHGAECSNPTISAVKLEATPDGTTVQCKNCHGATYTDNRPPEAPARYRLTCVRCDRTIRLHSPRPRLPLCDPCRAAGPRRKHPKPAAEHIDGRTESERP